MLILAYFVSACSLQIVEMAKEPTIQKYDLSDPEGDGVILARDKCPASKHGAKINNIGCGTETIVAIRYPLSVNFATNSSVVASRYFREIEKLSKIVKKNPEVKVVLEGHTSTLGTAIYNKFLAQRRAQAIKKILIEKYGIAPSRIVTIGYGFTHLLLEGDDEYVHARNRRVVADILTEKHIPEMQWTIYTVDEDIE